MKQLLSAMLFSSLVAVGAAKSGYLYYVGGTVPTGAVADDGTPTGDMTVFSVLVADVNVTAANVTVSNWRYATTPSNLIPADNPNTAGTVEKYSWMYIENNTHIYNNHLYTGPGDWNGDSSQSTGDSVAHAPINSNGTLGTWGFSPQFPAPTAQAIGGGALVDFGVGNAYVYVIGGDPPPSTARILASKIQANGTLGAWSPTTPLPAADWFNRATAVGSTVVVSDGNTVASSASHYTAANSATGALGSWTSIGPWASASRWSHGMISLTSPDGSRFAVIAGGSGPSAEVFTSKVTAGVPAAWTATNPMPLAKRQIATAAIDDVILVLGGTDGGGNSGVVDTVQAGRISNTGVITWTSSTTNPSLAPLPQARAFGGAAFKEVIPPPVVNSAKDWQLYR